MKQFLEATFGVYALVVALVFMLPGTLLIILTPGLGFRRRLARFLARRLLQALGAGPDVTGRETLPRGACVIVANHASYVDGILLKAVLPPRFSFVIKREARAMPVAGFMLARLGSEFVDRGDGQAGARDARRILRAASEGQAMGFFPEGTFIATPGLQAFRLGAFLTAARAGLPVVPVVIRGSRRLLGSGAWLPRPARLSVKILAPLSPQGHDRGAARRLRDRARTAILENLDEPDLLA